MLRILLTGGGSGGHIFPLVAVADELNKIAVQNNISIKIYYLGASGDFGTVLENAGIQVRKIAGGKIRNYFSFLNFFDIFRLAFSFLEALVYLLWLMPNVIFSKGGSGSFPVILAAAFYRIPVLVHDSDAIPGRSNQLSSRFAKRIAISFPSAAGYMKGNIAFTGNPIRLDLLSGNDSAEDIFSKMGFSRKLPFILVLGSSQGALRINDFILDNIGDFVKDFQILHQVGRLNYDEALKQSEFLLGNMSQELKSRYKIVPFLEEDYGPALRAADIVVGRASSGTIYEIAAFGKPSILIPLPEAAQDHQRENAYAYQATGAAVIIDQQNLLPNIFIEQVKKILGDSDYRAQMSQAALSFSKPEAARVIAGEVLNLAVK